MPTDSFLNIVKFEKVTGGSITGLESGSYFVYGVLSRTVSPRVLRAHKVTRGTPYLLTLAKSSALIA